MRARKSFLIAVICFFLGFIAIVSLSLAQEAQDEFPVAGAASGAKLVVTSVSGPPQAYLRGLVKVAYEIRNDGNETSLPYMVAVYLSADQQIDPKTDRLLVEVRAQQPLKPGKKVQQSRQSRIPFDIEPGDYFLCVLIEGGNSKASEAKLSIKVRYLVGEDGETITDEQTKLTWQRGVGGKQISWNDAGLYCENLVLGGNDDWRLPRVDELRTIVDYSRHHAAVDPVVQSHNSAYWSSNTLIGYEEAAWMVGFWSGWVAYISKTMNINTRVRCVRSGPFWPFDPSDHLVLSSSGNTVADTLTGLQWQQADDGGYYNFNDAQRRCRNLVLDGCEDWRVPTIEELMTIVNYSKNSPAISNIFSLQHVFYWSGSTCAENPYNAWTVNFNDGSTDDWSSKYSDDLYSVRCVRAGP